MRKIFNWVLAAILTISAASVFTSCSNNDDNPITPQPEPQTTLQVGSYVWGSTIYGMGTDGATRLAEAYEKSGIQTLYCSSRVKAEPSAISKTAFPMLP